MPPSLSLKIGVSGVRGIVGESLSPQLVVSFAAAFGTYCGAGPILIGTDTRPSREMLRHAVVAGLLSVGSTPVDVGIVPIPALMLHIREVGAYGGICISASHNPIEWNALKFIANDGIVLRPNQAKELTDLYHQGVYPRVGNNEMSEARVDTTTLARHRVAVTTNVDEKLIASRRFKVVVDCCNGAASQATPQFLRMLGCEVHELYTDVNSLFPHNPEPLAANIVDLCKTVQATGADIGFAQDADADRLAVVDERGQPIGEDATVSLAIRHCLKRSPGPVVVNLSTSRMIDDIAAAFGVPVYRSPVGEVNVVEAMIRHRADIGGEGNGGVILASVNPCRDSFIGMALILEALAQEGSTVSEMRSQIPSYAMIHEKLLCRARDIAPSLRLLKKLWKDHPMDLTDGVKINWSDRWIQARPSNTEPVIRLDAEAPTESEARSLINEALECLSPSA